MFFPTVLKIGLLIHCNSWFAEAQTASYDFSAYPECTEETLSIGTPPLPKLPPQFTIQAERKLLDLRDNAKLDLLQIDSVKGYYDTDGQRGTTIITASNGTLTYMFDFKRNDAYVIDDNQQCRSGDFGNAACHINSLFLSDLGASPKVTVTSGLCNLTVGPVYYMGPWPVRSIPARKWKQCSYDSQRNIVAVIFYYSAAAGFVTANITDDIAVRLEYKVLNGTGLGTLRTYDFTSFTAGVSDSSAFLPPLGAYCPTWFRENKTIPALKDKFTLTMMTVAKRAKEVHNMRVYYDQQKQHVAFMTDSANGTRFPPAARNFSNRGNMYITVHDFRSGLSFVSRPRPFGAGGMRNCSITTIDPTAMDSVDPNEANSSTVRIRNSNELFDMTQPGWIYVGERDFHNVRCYTWIRQKLDTLQRVTELYFMKEEWTVNNVSTFFGMIRYRRNLNGTAIETYNNMVTDYDTVSPFAAQFFDVSGCLRTTHPILVAVTIKVDNYTATSGSFQAFTSGMKEALATDLSTSSLRIADMEFSQGANVTNNQPQLWFTLFEWVNVTGRPGAPLQKPSQAVVDDLKSRMTDSDYPLTVTYNNKTETVTLLRNSLQSGADLAKPTTTKAPRSSYRPTSSPGNMSAAGNENSYAAVTNVIQQGYTSGDMTGLAFAMIIIAGLAGLAAGFFLHKRSAPVPYHQDANL